MELPDEKSCRYKTHFQCAPGISSRGSAQLPGRLPSRSPPWKSLQRLAARRARGVARPDLPPRQQGTKRLESANFSKVIILSFVSSALHVKIDPYGDPTCVLCHDILYTCWMAG